MSPTFTELNLMITSCKNLNLDKENKHLELTDVKVHPLYDRVLLHRIDEPVRGLIITPDAAKEKSQKGLVVEVGQGYLNKDTGTFTPMVVKKGDKVIFGKYAGTDVKMDGKEVLLVREDEILGILEPIKPDKLVSK